MSATPAASITVLLSGGMASESLRFILATSTEASAFPGAMILASGIPSGSCGTTSYARVADKAVEYRKSMSTGVGPPGPWHCAQFVCR